jgi:hypothetical protein
MKPVRLQRLLAFIGTAAILSLGARHVIAEDQIPVEFRGDWVPAKATCQSPLRFRIAETRMTLVNGKDSASYGDIGITHTYFGPEYQGISFVAIPELNSGNSPFTVFFNADEKKGVTRVDIYQEIKGPMNAQLKAIQQAAKKLAERFPLNSVALKKCSGEKG